MSKIVFHKSPVDLTTCKKGDKLKLRNGEEAKYAGKRDDPRPHRIDYADGAFGYRWDNGMFEIGFPKSGDVVEIIREEPKSNPEAQKLRVMLAEREAALSLVEELPWLEYYELIYGEIK